LPGSFSVTVVDAEPFGTIVIEALGGICASMEELMRIAAANTAALWEQVRAFMPTSTPTFPARETNFTFASPKPGDFYQCLTMGG
jgi:hypothetical protein